MGDSSTAASARSAAAHNGSLSNAAARSCSVIAHPAGSPAECPVEIEQDGVEGCHCRSLALPHKNPASGVQLSLTLILVAVST